MIASGRCSYKVGICLYVSNLADVKRLIEGFKTQIPPSMSHFFPVGVGLLPLPSDSFTPLTHTP
jgi:hypothetical protein